jgi:hypothetical protein
MTAQEMFESLGYEIFDDDDYRLSYVLTHNNNLYFVNFYKNHRTYNIDVCYVIDIKLHKAIHQQMKELGWIE